MADGTFNMLLFQRRGADALSAILGKAGGGMFMEQLELYVPKLEDLWFYQQMMSDPETMAYNANWNVE